MSRVAHSIAFDVCYLAHYSSLISGPWLGSIFTRRLTSPGDLLRGVGTGLTDVTSDGQLSIDDVATNEAIKQLIRDETTATSEPSYLTPPPQNRQQASELVLEVARRMRKGNRA